MLTVTAPASVRTLVTLAAVKAELGITTGDDDAILSDYIAMASAAAESYCRRVFALETVSETLRPERTVKAVVLARRPVTAVASVTVAGVALTGAEWELDGPAGLLYRLYADERTSWSAEKVAVAYTAGYATIPADVARAVTMLVVGYHASQGRDPTLRTETVDGVGGFGYVLAGAVGGMPGSLPGQVAQLLDRYLDWSV